MKTKTVIFSVFGALAGAMLLGGCAKEPVVPAEGDRPIPVNFTAGIEAALPEVKPHATRTAPDADGNAVWTQGDVVGIYMMSAGETQADNIAYSVDPATGALTPAEGTSIYYPQDKAADFIAYYPYIEDWEIAANAGWNFSSGVLTDQTTAEKLTRMDVLYSDNAKSISRSKDAVALSFRHALSKLRFEITLSPELAGGSVTDVVLNGMPDRAFINMNDGSISVGNGESAAPISALKLDAPPAGTDAAFTVIVSPQSAGAWPDRTIAVTVDGNTFTGPIPDADAFAANTTYVYPVTVRRAGVEVGSSRIGDWTVNDGGTGEASYVMNIDKVRIPAGTFLMGSSDGSNIDDKNGSGLNTTPAERDRLDDEIQHRVTLTRDFYMSRYEITNEQFAAFLNDIGVGSDCQFTKKTYPNGLNPDKKLLRDCGDYSVIIVLGRYGVQWVKESSRWIPMEGYEKHPAVFITWYGAVEFAHWAGGRLPTEAEWEYACRAGTTTACYFGDDISSVNNYVSHHNNNTEKTTKPVGQKLPNRYGLYDMYGNAWEWCADRYGSYDTADVTDPTGPATGYPRVTRGGAWYNDPEYFRSAYRCIERFAPNYCDSGTGFRVVFD